VTRHPIHTSRFYSGYDVGPRRFDPQHCHWAVVVGDRIRRIRTARGWRLVDLAQAVTKSDGTPLYSFQHLSRLERGWATAPLYVYLAIAAAFDIDPGRLLGADAAMLETTEAELTLLRALRELELEPHKALAELLQARSTAMRSSRPSMRVESPPPS
jgi:transcriptional regulator with XRE-family HTH domain